MTSFKVTCTYLLYTSISFDIKDEFSKGATIKGKRTDFQLNANISNWGEWITKKKLQTL